MHTLKSIHLQNIQAIRDYTFEFPETGLIRFSGNNSNGKSIITKTTLDIIRGNITKPIVRNTLINKHAVVGEITYETYDGQSLFVHLQREHASTYVTLSVPNFEPVTRYLADKSWLQLVHTFGFVYNENRDIALQIIDDDSLLLFLATSDRINGELLQTASSDALAENALEQFRDLQKYIQRVKGEQIHNELIYKQTLGDFKVWDLEPLEKEERTLDTYLRILENFVPMTLPELPDMTSVEFYTILSLNLPGVMDMTPIEYYPLPECYLVDIPDMTPIEFYELSILNIPDLAYPLIIDLQFSLPDIEETMQDLDVLREGRCPTCGKMWME